MLSLPSLVVRFLQHSSILDKAPKLVNLAKKVTISLEKRQLQQLTAKVALVLDASGSMKRQYKQGRVQEVVNRILPLAVSFDDDQALDCWAFERDPQYLGELGLRNYDDFIEHWQRNDYVKIPLFQDDITKEKNHLMLITNSSY